MRVQSFAFRVSDLGFRDRVPRYGAFGFRVSALLPLEILSSVNLNL